MAETIAIARPRPRGASIDREALLVTVLLGIVALLVVTPLLITIISSFQTARPGQPAVWGLGGWRDAVTEPGIVNALLNTFSLAFVRQAIALVVGVLLAWLVARTDLPWRGPLEFLFWVSFFLPALPLTMGWILLMDPKVGLANQAIGLIPFAPQGVFNIYSYWGIVFTHLSAGGIGAKVLLLTPAFRNLNAALEESSRSCGASTLGTLWRVVVPLMAPAILVTTVVGIIRSLEAFEIELLLGTPINLFVYSTKIRDLIVFEPPRYAAATALGTLFLALLLGLVTLQRRALGNRIYRTVTGKGFSTAPVSLGRWRYPVAILVLAIGITATILPIAVLLMGTFMTSFGHFNIPTVWTMNNWDRVLKDPQLTLSFQNTLIVGFSSAVVGVIVYGLIAYAIVRTRSRWRTTLDVLSWLPWAVPGVLMSLALLWTVFQTRVLLPLYGTVALLAIAMFIKGMPLGVQLIKSGLMQLGDDLEEAGRVAGGSWIQTYVRVVMPLLYPTLLSVGLVTFLSAARDISTVFLLGSGRSRTLALLALDHAASGQYERATVVSVIIVAIVVVIALLARRIGGRLGVVS